MARWSRFVSGRFSCHISFFFNKKEKQVCAHGVRHFFNSCGKMLAKMQTFQQISNNLQLYICVVAYRMFIIILPVHISVNRMKQNQERLLLHSFRISGFFKYAFLKFPKFQHRVVFSKLRCSTTPRYSSPSESLPFPHDSSNLFKTQYPMQSPECRFIFSKKMGKTEF